MAPRGPRGRGDAAGGVRGQLALNVLWSGLFFGLRAPGAAILATILPFRRTSAVAALLLVSYLAWVTFDAVLNYEIWRLNL